MVRSNVASLSPSNVASTSIEGHGAAGCRTTALEPEKRPPTHTAWDWNIVNMHRWPFQLLAIIAYSHGLQHQWPPPCVLAAWPPRLSPNEHDPRPDWRRGSSRPDGDWGERTSPHGETVGHLGRRDRHDVYTKLKGTAHRCRSHVDVYLHKSAPGMDCDGFRHHVWSYVAFNCLMKLI